ncbi:MAG: hypothetical protein NDJ94_16320 [Vicinamibacteria bacterium]|nr:hypothetical protein [Vicinamibacteria bacterium]
MSATRKIVVLVLLLAAAPAWAVGKREAQFTGGTTRGVPLQSEGVLITDTDKGFVFLAEKGQGSLEIGWARILDIDYGQKKGKLGSRAHFLTLTYRDPKGSERTASFELGKDLVYPTLDLLEQKTKRKVTYLDDEAAQARQKERAEKGRGK